MFCDWTVLDNTASDKFMCQGVLKEIAKMFMPDY